MKVAAYSILASLAVGGFAVGRLTAPTKVVTETVTLTETVEVPVYTADRLPEADIYYYDIPLSHSLQRFIYEICADYNVPVSLVLAMIEHESGFNQRVISSTDDYGLMQINAINHEWLEETYRTADMLDPYQNIYCGVRIIAKYLEKYDGDITRALMAYNLGDYGARKAWESGVTSTKYTARILSLMQTYEEVRHG